MDEKPGMSRRAKIAALCAAPVGLLMYYGLYQLFRHIFGS